MPQQGKRAQACARMDHQQQGRHQPKAGQRQSGHQQAQRTDETNAIGPHRIGDRPESADGRHPQQETYDGKLQLGQNAQAPDNGLARRADMDQPKAYQTRDEEHGQDVSGGKSGKEGFRHHAQQKFARPIDGRSGQLVMQIDAAGHQRGNLKTGARTQQAGHQQAHQQRADGDRSKHDQRPRHRGARAHRPAMQHDAIHDGAEQDRGHHHPHRLDKSNAQRPQLHAQPRPEIAHDDTGQRPQHNLHIKMTQHSSSPGYLCA